MKRKENSNWVLLLIFIYILSLMAAGVSLSVIHHYSSLFFWLGILTSIDDKIQGKRMTDYGEEKGEDE